MRLSDNTYISIKSLILMYSYISQYNFGEYTIYTKKVFLIILNYDFFFYISVAKLKCLSHLIFLYLSKCLQQVMFEPILIFCINTFKKPTKIQNSLALKTALFYTLT